jgi:hypothetical protein
MQSPKIASAILAGAAGVATVIWIASAMIIVPSRQTMATEEIAKATGDPCAKCHTAPPTLNDFGKKYQEDHKGK